MQVAPPFHEPDTVEHHGLENLSMAEAEMGLSGLGDGTSDDLGNAKGIEGAGDDSDMPIEISDPSVEVSSGGHSRNFS